MRFSGPEDGIGLFEVIAGTLIATLAVLGLAYSFGIGRGLIDRYQLARAALGEAQKMVDSLITVQPGNLVTGSQVFWVEGHPVGNTAWTVTTVDDPADGLGWPADPDTVDMDRLRVSVSWDIGGAHDELALTRLVAIK